MKVLRVTWTAVAVLIAAVGCQEKQTLPPVPPPSVVVATPVQQAVADAIIETGQTKPVEVAEIRARVQGFLAQVNFEAGNQVNAGDVLFQIEPEQFQAARDAAQAALDASTARVQQAKEEYQRQQNLFERKATSEQDLLAAETRLKLAEADENASKAALDKAVLDLDYTEVKAPFSGRVGEAVVKVGNLVGAGDATKLTTLISYDPIYVYFNLSETQALQLREAGGNRDLSALRDAPEENRRVYLKRAIDDDFRFEGLIDFVELGVDQSTGTFQVRATVPNPDGILIPGLFVTVKFPLREERDALLIPESAVLSDPQGHYVLVVGADDRVALKYVELGPKVGTKVAIRQGLEPDDRVVVDGVLTARIRATQPLPENQTVTIQAAADAESEEATETPDDDASVSNSDDPGPENLDN